MADKKKKPVSPFMKAFSVTLLTGGLIIIALLAFFVLKFAIDGLAFDVGSYKLNLSSFVYYTDDKNTPIPLETLHGQENRIWVSLDKIPKNLQNAFIAIEDERFKSHKGIDLKRTTGAIVNTIIKRQSDFGGSTLTQQLVKNLTGDKDATPDRKLREIFRAIAVERQLSKDQILELYLNTIYLGEGCNGVQSASYVYFGKDVSLLSLAECASIAGITQFPTKYDPYINPAANKEKQELILQKMIDLGFINKNEYSTSIAQKLKLSRSNVDSAKASGSQSYFTDAVIADVINDLKKDKNMTEAAAQKLVYSGGLKIYSTYDPKVQAAIDKVFHNPDNFPVLKTAKQPEAAMVILDPYTGAVKGLVGGVGVKKADFILNRATSTYRQPGSTIKPIAVYGPAIEKNLITPATVVVDEPIDIAGWKPNNYYNYFKGPVTVRYAIEDSINIVAAKVAQMVGVDESFKFLTEKLHISSLVNQKKMPDGSMYSDRNLSAMALGGLTEGVTILEMTAAYTPFVNKGIYTRPFTYTKVVDNNGKVLLEKKQQINIAFSPQTAYIMNNLLISVVRSSMGSPARLSSGITAGGKTGSTNEDKDRWFIGFTPYYLGGVWYGFDTPSPLPFNPTGAMSLKIWKKVMDELHKGKSQKNFEMPTGIVNADICKKSGLLATNSCRADNSAVSEIFKAGNLPKSSCNYHGSLPAVNPNAQGGDASSQATDSSPAPATTGAADSSVINLPATTVSPAATATKPTEAAQKPIVGAGSPTRP